MRDHLANVMIQFLVLAVVLENPAGQTLNSIYIYIFQTKSSRTLQGKDNESLSSPVPSQMPFLHHFHRFVVTAAGRRTSRGWHWSGNQTCGTDTGCVCESEELTCPVRRRAARGGACSFRPAWFLQPARVSARVGESGGDWVSRGFLNDKVVHV